MGMLVFLMPMRHHRVGRLVAGAILTFRKVHRASLGSKIRCAPQDGWRFLSPTGTARA